MSLIFFQYSLTTFDFTPGNSPSYAASCHNLCRVVTTSGGDFYLTVYQSSGDLLAVRYSYMRAIMISKDHFVGTIGDVENSIDTMYT